MKYACGICLSLFSTSNYNILKSTLVECFLLVFNLYLISINSSFAKVFHQEKRLDASRHKIDNFDNSSHEDYETIWREEQSVLYRPLICPIRKHA